MKILLVRTDKIGDFVLCWPAMQMLKTAFPESKIDIMVANCNIDLAKACPFVDDVYLYQPDSDKLKQQLTQVQYDAAIAINNDWQIGKFLRDLNIPKRFCRRFKWYHWLYTDHVAIHRIAGKAGWTENCRQIEQFISAFDRTTPELTQPVWDVTDKKSQWQAFYQKKDNEKLIFIHSGTGGSAKPLKQEQFVELTALLTQHCSVPFKIVLTYSGNEKQATTELAEKIKQQGVNVMLAPELTNLGEFAESLVAADMFIAASTGPLHLASLHNVITVGFYTARKSVPKIRWQTLSESNNRLAFTPPAGRKNRKDMSLINMRQVALACHQRLE